MQKPPNKGRRLFGCLLRKAYKERVFFCNSSEIRVLNSKLEVDVIHFDRSNKIVDYLSGRTLA